ncbi:hypothetical protein AWM75_02020 [Aerococcus urinaehominis]|uniref:ATP-dependent helicase/nuclease subunit A n=1 Tax=Aerococcus urinaehominis TaxID=128944 RepID=A0A0X8FLI7_9LACT|nr:helicase-exonuclease AddAB subunit AddA [Aerococcus urinaehominis]AMB98842.1 hypothetical protein AWM75_02020 [Aerococcus urinaehominis]SDM17566.1 DNA helicase/exodeoxyribonuclease V, subunit A [Aerococcus urinaehominis]
MTKTPSNYTDSQWQAIQADGKHILVSASAGSGKTRVLVTRILEKIKKGISVDQLLVVTFTEKAAKEMKERLETSLKDLVVECQDSELRDHYLSQIHRLPSAHISTIDAFCRQVIQSYYYLIDLDPVYRLVTDQTEEIMNRQDIWEDLKEDLLGQDNPYYLVVADNYASGRGDQGLDEIIFDLYDKARSHANPSAWLDQLLVYYQPSDQLTTSRLYQDLIKPELVSQLQQLLTQYDNLIAITPSQEAVGFAKFSADVKQRRDQLVKLMDLVQVGTYSDLYQAFNQPLAKVRNKVKKDYADDQAMLDYRDQLRDQLKLIKDNYDKIIDKYFAFDEETQLNFLKEASRLAHALVAVEKEFMQAMTAFKTDQRLMDFADVEYYTLQILNESSQPDSLNEASAYYQAKFEEVMVDEYQDVNALQEAILQAVSHQDSDQNMFMVGDIKQSIYRFRFAEPQLFVDKFDAFADGNQGERILLAENFRSRPEILYLTNYIFQQIMDTSLGKIDYNQEAEFKLGSTNYDLDQDMPVELLLFDKDSLADQSLVKDSDEAQVEMIAQRIRQMIDQGEQINDGGPDKWRKIDYGDIVILSATRGHHLAVEKIFADYQIPLEMDNLTNYFTRSEITTILSVMKFIDNPYQDIPLASVLRSPIMGLSESDLAKIRLAGPNMTYYQAMLAYIDQADPRTVLAQKLGQLVAWHEKWRDMARDQSLSQLIWQIYNDTGFLEFAAGMPNGLQRQANLHGLYLRASDFEKTNFKGLFQFIRFIELMQASDNDLEEVKHQDIEGNRVRLMTIHASKGLESPIVFYLNLSRQFNQEDLKGGLVVSDGAGLGVKINNHELHMTYPNLAFQASRDQVHQDMMAEEMRKLYVALTRAEQKLIMLASIDKWEATLLKWQSKIQGGQRLLPYASRLEVRSPLDWIGPALMRHKDFGQINHSVHLETMPAKPGQAFKLQLARLTAADIISQRPQEQVTSNQEIDLAACLSNDHLDQGVVELGPRKFSYPYQNASETTSYQSVSELKRLLYDPDDLRLDHQLMGRPSQQRQVRYVEEDRLVPKFLQEDQGVSAAEIGTANHLLMQTISFDYQPSSQDFRVLFDQLQSRGLIRSQLADHIDFDHLAAFFKTAIGQELIRQADLVKREESFSLTLPAKKIFPETPAKDQLLVHGTIDGFILYPDEILLYDFKTDRIAYLSQDQQADLLRQRYQTQIDLYAEALETIFQKPVKDRIIIGLDTLITVYA